MKKSSSGFTMIELMLVTIFLAIIGTYTWSYLRLTLKTQKIIEEKTSLQQTGIAVINKIQEDISQTFIVESYQKLTFFKGNNHELSFTSISHDAPNPDDRESDQAEISYYLESNSQSSQVQNLMRKEVPYLTGEQERDDQFKGLVVSDQVSEFELSYSNDAIKYVQEWDTASQDTPNKLPKLIKVSIKIKDEKEREEVFETLIDLPMSENLNVELKAATPAQGGPGSKTDGQTGTGKPTGQQGQKVQSPTQGQQVKSGGGQ
jgi:type II secretory pathway pseudopilin PulG